MKTIAFGEIIWDVYPDEAVIGGAPFNFCAHLAHLGDTAYLASATGADKLGKEALAHMRVHGVRTDLMQSGTHPTGQCTVTLNADKIPQYEIVADSAYDNLTATEPYLQKIREIGADVFYFNTLIQRGPVSREALVRILQTCTFPDIFCDINLRKDCFDEESCRLCLESATILKLSDEEEPLLSEFGFYESAENEEKLLENIATEFPNIRLILFTKGENGSVIYDARSGGSTVVPAVKAQVVSTVGAGDSYSAAFLCEYLQSGDIAKAGQAGAALSSYVVSHKEAIPF